MSVERIVVNGHELTAFDLPPEPTDTYVVHVDGLGDVVVEKGKPPKEKDVPAMYMRKLVPELCEQNAELHRENAKLRELVTETIRLMQADGPDCGLCKHYDECWTGEAMDYSPSGCVICNEARKLGIEVG